VVTISEWTCCAGTVSGKVFDRAGAVIRGARVTIHWDPSGSNQLKDITGDSREDVSVVTGEDGRFSVKLKPGFYDVFVAATGFSPHCEKVRLKDKEVKMSVTLDVRSIVIRETGDSVVVD
jgi:Carboxypeptidase regulatory-like domain